MTVYRCFRTIKNTAALMSIVVIVGCPLSYVFYHLKPFGMTVNYNHVVSDAVNRVQNFVQTRLRAETRMIEMTSYLPGEGTATRQQPFPSNSTTIKVQLYSTSLTAWISNGSEDDNDETSIEVDGGRPRYVQCNKSLILEISITGTSSSFHGQDAIVFNDVESGLLTSTVTLLQRLSAQQGHTGQVWLYQALESASYMRWLQPAVSSLPIHGVMGYPSTAEITSVYGRYVPGHPVQNPNGTIEGLIKKKTSKVAWVARNCNNTFWPRLQYVHDLQKHISVDVYGSCGTLSCLPRRSQKCIQMLEKYKFFLAIENSECPDYITEKFWNALDHGIVPVVYGPSKAMYERVAPPNSFIHIADYGSVKELAEYLHHLDKNPKEYAKYFEWRRAGSYRHAGENPIPFCQIPEVIQRVKREGSTRKPLSAFPFYSSCRAQQGHDGFRTSVTYETWKPR